MQLMNKPSVKNSSKKFSEFNSYLKAILFIYLFTVFSGAFRKWFNFSDEFSNIIFFLQLLVPYSFLLIKGGMKKWQLGLPVFMLLILVLAIGVFNPWNFTIFHG